MSSLDVGLRPTTDTATAVLPRLIRGKHASTLVIVVANAELLVKNLIIGPGRR